MTLTITEHKPATAQEWDGAWSACDHATYFQSPEWADIWNVYTQGKITPKPLLLTFSDGLTVVLPMSSRSVMAGMFQEYLLSPGGTYGGWLNNDRLSAEHVTQLVKFIPGYCRQVVWRLNPYDEQGGLWQGHPAESDESHAIDLSAGFETIFKQWSKGHRSAAKKSCREGVVVSVASTIEEWRAYYAAYEDSLRRWGDKASITYPWSFFEDLYRRKSNHIKLWLGGYDGKIIAGQLCFYAKNHVVYWHGAALEEFFNLRPVHWGLHEIIRDACDNGFHWFDFNPSGGNEGVKSFKRGFGATSRPCPVVKVNSGGLRVARALAARLRK